MRSAAVFHVSSRPASGESTGAQLALKWPHLCLRAFFGQMLAEGSGYFIEDKDYATLSVQIHTAVRQ